MSFALVVFMFVAGLICGGGFVALWHYIDDADEPEGS